MQALVSLVWPGSSDPFTGRCRCFRPSDRDAGWACWIVEGEWEGCGQLGEAIHLTVPADIIQFIGFFCHFQLRLSHSPPCWAQCTSCSLSTSWLPIFSLD